VSGLAAQVRAVVSAMADVVPPAEGEVLRAARHRLDEPLRVAIAGRVKAGKSTLLNALVGTALAATDATECTRCLIWYRNGSHYGASALDRHGTRHDARLHIDEDRAVLDLGGLAVEDVAHIEVSYPSQHLSDLTLIDTPGVASISEQVSARTAAFLTPPSGDGGADVVVYLLRHLHRADSDFLEAFTDASALADPVRSVGVLGRADEVGAGRGDSMVLARRIAQRYATDGAVARRVSGVLPVSGLLAFTAATLNQREFDHLGTLAAMPVASTDRLVLSADRFVADSSHCPLPPAARRRLLDRLGMFGIRFSLAAYRSGTVCGIDDLERELREVSGIDPLRTLILDRYAARADVLKAARCLTVARAVAERADVGRDLALELGRIEVNAHELEELRCLRILQDGRSALPEPLQATVARALGGDGPTPQHRLGLAEDAAGADAAAEARRVVVDLRRDRSRPLLSSEAARVLDAAITSLERVHARVTAAGG
jgi:hypothetical protein